MTPLRFLGMAMLATFLAITALPAAAATMVVQVNGQSITDVQVAQRLGLLRIEGKNNRQAAIDELINEALQLQEAERRGIVISDSVVDDALANVAQRARLSVSNLTKVLNDAGVPVVTLRERLRASIAWQRVTAQALNSRVQVSEADVDAKAKQQLTAANSFDYILKEVMFFGGNASRRTADANKYRSNFNGCDAAVQLSLNYTDAAVRDLGRRHATQFPEALANELSKLNVGGITKPRTVEGGVSMLAVCAKTQSEDTTYLAQAIRQESGNAGLKAEADKYLAELRAKAQIIKG
jgi:peptidyl-prolyl cis-trans isomerase SurA